MSVVESWAMIEPSTYSTIEWTIDCGWMSDVDAVGVHGEEVMGLDDFQPLVHHRGGVDGDLVSHLPGRMRERGLDA